MYLNQLKIGAAAVLTLAMLGTGIGSMAHWARADRPAAERPAADAQQPGERENAAGRDGGRNGTDVSGKVVAVAKDGKSIVLQIPAQDRGAEPKKIDIKIGDKTVVVYHGVAADGARPTEGYDAQARLEDGGTAASVSFRGSANTRNPDVSGKVVAVAGDGKGITVEVAPARGRGNDVEEAKTVQLKLNDRTVVLFSGVAKGGARLVEGLQAQAWLENGPNGTTAGSVHLTGAETRSRRDQPASVVGKVVAVTKDGVTLETRPQQRGEEPARVDIKLGDKAEVVYQNVGLDGTKVVEGFQASIWLAEGSKDSASKAVFSGVPKERWPLVAGKVVAVGKDGTSFTLEQPAETRGDEPKRIGVRVTDKTRISFSGVGPDGAKPAEGYHVQVWLEEESKDRAVQVAFTNQENGGRR